MHYFLVVGVIPTIILVTLGMSAVLNTEFMDGIRFELITSLTDALGRSFSFQEIYSSSKINSNY